MKISQSDVSYVFMAAVAALVLMALMHIINPIINPRQETAEKKIISEISHSVKPIRASEILQLLRNDEGKNTMVIIYASWCGFCRELLPDVIDMVKEDELAHVNLELLSLDTNFGLMGRYLAENDYYQYFTPYVVKQSAINPLNKALFRTGSRYNGAIPYIGVFDDTGRVITEAYGAVGQRRLLDMSKQSN